MPARRTYLASLAGLAGSASLSGCSLLAQGDGEPAPGESAIAAHDGRTLGSDVGSVEWEQFSIEAIDRERLRARLSDERREAVPLWSTDEPWISDSTTYHQLSVQQSTPEGTARTRYEVTAGDVDRSRAVERFGLEEAASERHDGFDCYGVGDTDDSAGAAEQVAVAEDALISVSVAELTGSGREPRRIDVLEYATGLWRASGRASGWVADALDAVTPADQLEFSTASEESSAVQAFSSHVRDSEVVRKGVLAYPTRSAFQREHGNVTAREHYAPRGSTTGRRSPRTRRSRSATAASPSRGRSRSRSSSPRPVLPIGSRRPAFDGCAHVGDAESDTAT